MLTPDEERDVWYANRMVLLLRPRSPFLEWVEVLGDEDDEGSSPNEPVAFLIPLFDFWEDAEGWIRENHLLIFETVLWSWAGDSAAWPIDRSWDVFQSWFDVELFNAPWDVVAAPLHSNPPPPDGDWN